jgi:AraC family transcriptional regulator of adaptative response / DNA-3-methyladenine glycosylase II
VPLADRLPVRPPFAHAHLLNWLAARAIPGVEVVRQGTYARTTRTGAIATLTPSDAGVDLRVDGAPAGMSQILADHVARARRLLDLDADPRTIDAALGAHPRLRASVAARPGLRVPGAWDGFELVVRAILGQQISVVAASGLAGRVVALCGTPLDHPRDGLTHLFPTPAQLAAAAPAIGFMPASRALALQTAAEAVADGRVDLSPGADPVAARAALLALRGIGPWTVEYVAMRALRDPDAFPASDLVLRRALGDDPGAADRCRPWRAYAAMHLWAEAGVASATVRAVTDAAGPTSASGGRS